MSEEKSIVVCGIGETASATARRLFAEGHAVAMFRATAPRLLRRRMSFVDAWFDGYASLDGMETRRADVSNEFLLGLQTRQFIPLLRTRITEVLERWPWDAIVAIREPGEPLPPSLRDMTELSIGLGPGFSAGQNCDLVIEIDGPDPGAILQEGAVPDRRKSAAARSGVDHQEVVAPGPGLFRASASIGAIVDAGETLGFVGDAPVVSPVGGRVKGIARKELAVLEGAPIAEIALSRSARVSGVSDRDQLVARGVAFAIEMEAEGWKPFSVESWS
jgi:xanthine dehydrogenase accessory factor